MKKYSFFIIIIGMIFTISACSNTIEDSVSWKIDSFKAVTQENKPFTKKDLEGKIWVSDFVFTSCTTVCPPMTSNMKRIQNMLKDEKLDDDVNLLSFTVDPTVDSPKVLMEYAQKYGIDQKNWIFLTGYSQDTIDALAKSSFETLVAKPKNSDQVMHGTKFYLINEKGIIVKQYDGVSDTPYDEIVNDIKKLTRS